MKKSMNKLIASGFLVLVAIVLMVTVSYAWFTLAGSPALTGIQINIGGTNTIRVAPDVTEKLDDGTIVHYPGYFNETFDVAYSKSYSYLESLAGLSPVSTADGLNWFYLGDDADLEANGSTTLSDYKVDKTLQNANITVEEGNVNGKNGSYVYIDFWVVSPTSDCNLRVSIGSQEEGSYVIGLPEDDEAAAAARVGFLVNDDTISDTDAPMAAYVSSSYYSNEYTSLKGYYQEPGKEAASEKKYRFTIYEPNSLQHNGVGISLVQGTTGLTYQSCEEGDYAITRPIGYKEDGSLGLINVSDYLTVQKNNEWDSDIYTILESKDGELPDNFSAFVNRASFFENTNMLYYSGDGTFTPEENMEYLKEVNATSKTVIVTLERNVPQRIRMYVWLEGQDVDCVREAALENLAIGIELAGSTSE